MEKGNFVNLYQNKKKKCKRKNLKIKNLKEKNLKEKIEEKTVYFLNTLDSPKCANFSKDNCLFSLPKYIRVAATVASDIPSPKNIMIFLARFGSIVFLGSFSASWR